MDARAHQGGVGGHCISTFCKRVAKANGGAPPSVCYGKSIFSENTSQRENGAGPSTGIGIESSGHDGLSSSLDEEESLPQGSPCMHPSEAPWEPLECLRPMHFYIDVPKYEDNT